MHIEHGLLNSPAPTVPCGPVSAAGTAVPAMLPGPFFVVQLTVFVALQNHAELEALLVAAHKAVVPVSLPALFAALHTLCSVEPAHSSRIHQYHLVLPS